MSKQLASITVFVAMMFVSVIAFAADAVIQQTWWQLLLNNIITIVFSIITPVLSFFVWRLLARYKINLELSAIDSITSKVVSYGEEAAHKALKDGQPLTAGADKMKVAVDIAQSLMTQYKLPKLAEETLIKLIESKLGEGRVVVAPAKDTGVKDEPTKP